jgi:hypothetical protein
MHFQFNPIRPANSDILRLNIADSDFAKSTAFKGYLKPPSPLTQPTQLFSFYTSQDLTLLSTSSIPNHGLIYYVCSSFLLQKNLNGRFQKTGIPIALKMIFYAELFSISIISGALTYAFLFLTKKA